MMWYYSGGNWLWMAAMMVVFWGAIVALVVFAIRAFRPGPPQDSAIETLRHRLAAGEISQEEFDRTRQALAT